MGMPMAVDDDEFGPLGELSPVLREDWDFDAVPDSEIIACALWEYARESYTRTVT
jgi:hypothetical protein